MKQIYFLGFLLSLFFISCKTASKAYEQGDYKNAVELAIKKLQKNPDDPEQKRILQKAYQHAVERHEDQIRILSASTSDKKWEQMYYEYRALQNLYLAIRQYPSVTKAVHAKDYSGFVQTYQDKAADTHFEKGLKWMEEDNKPSYREAYRALSAALKFRPDDFEIKKKQQEAYMGAIVHVVLQPFDPFQNSYYYDNSAYQMRNFQSRLMRSLNQQAGHNFIRFYTPWEAQSQDIEADEVLEMRFGRLFLGQPYDQQSSRRVSKKVVVKEIVYSKDSVVKEYATVNATITQTRRTLVSYADLYLTSRDGHSRILWSDNVRGEHRWQTEFASYTGDERALGENDKAQVNQRGEQPPREEDVVSEILRQMENNLTQRLRQYYARY